MPDIPFHEAAEIFPLMTGDDFDELVEDIREHGLRVPIELLDGKVIDGRNRYRGCLVAGVEQEYVDVEVEDPAAYVISMNLHRRHLDQSQRAMVAARSKEFYEDEAKKRRKRKPKSEVGPGPQQNEDQGKSRDKAGEAFGVSGDSVDRAKKVIDKGSPVLQAAVESGEVPVKVAAKLADLPRGEQTKAVKAGKAAIKEAVATISTPPSGKTPQQEANEDPERRWHASLHKIYVLLTSTRDLGGIAKLAKKWTANGKEEWIAELQRVIGELQKWVHILEKKK